MGAVVSKVSSIVRAIWRSPGYLIAAGIVVLVLLEEIPRGEAPIPEHTYQPGNAILSHLWEIKNLNLYSALPVADDRALYVSEYVNYVDRLSAIDANTGQNLWVQSLSSAREHAGVRSIITAQGSLYATNATELLAYDAGTGQALWVTEIGSGHVQIIPTILGKDILVYYGNTLIQVPLSTGKPVQSQPLGSLLWALQDIEIHTGPSGMIGVSSESGDILWHNSYTAFALNENRPPIFVTPDRLLVSTYDTLCLLNLITGRYSWCTPGTFVSNAVVGPVAGKAFVLDDKFNLLRVDLATGEFDVAGSYPGGILPADTSTYYPYYLTSSLSKLFIYFGDSRQMFSVIFE